MTLKNNRVSLLYPPKLCASFHFITICELKQGFLTEYGPCDLKIWRLISKKNTIGHHCHTPRIYVCRFLIHNSSVLCHFKRCATFRSLLWFQTEVTVRKCDVGLKFILTSVTVTFGLWPWPVAWASFSLKVITPEHFMVILGTLWKGVTDKQIGGRADGQEVHRASWSQHKNYILGHLGVYW